MDIGDFFVRAAFAVCIAIIVWLVAFALPAQYDRESRAKEASNGCAYLGHPRDLNSVFFYDCDGAIVMKRVK